MSTLELEHIKHASSSSNNLSVHSDGSLGIGTASPTVKLEAAGDIKASVSGTNAQISAITDGASNYAGFTATNGSRSYSMQIRPDQSNAFTIRDETGGGNRLLVDTGGAVTMPNQPSALFQGNDGSWATINGGNVLNRAFTSSGNGAHAHSSITYNQSNGRFTMTKAGKYFVSFTFYCDATANTDMRIILRQNGGGIAFNHYDFVSSQSTIGNSSTACLNIAANDYIDFYTPYQLSNYHGPQHSFVNIFKVS